MPTSAVTIKAILMAVAAASTAEEKTKATQELLSHVDVNHHLQTLHVLFVTHSASLSDAKQRVLDMVVAGTLSASLLFGTNTKGVERFTRMRDALQKGGDVLKVIEDVQSAITQALTKEIEKDCEQAALVKGQKKLDNLKAQFHKLTGAQKETTKFKNLERKLKDAEMEVQSAEEQNRFAEVAKQLEQGEGVSLVEMVLTDATLADMASSSQTDPAVLKILERRNTERRALLNTPMYAAYADLQAVLDQCNIRHCLAEYSELTGALFKNGKAAEESGASFESDVFQGVLHQQLKGAVLCRATAVDWAKHKLLLNWTLFDKNGKLVGEADGLLVCKETGKLAFIIECKRNPFEVGDGIVQGAKACKVLNSGGWFGWFGQSGEQPQARVVSKEAAPEMCLVVTTESRIGGYGIQLPGCLRREVLMGAVIHAAHMKTGETSGAHLQHCAGAVTYLLQEMKGALTLGTEVVEKTQHLPASQQPVAVLFYPE